jgi:hypothetical protein
MPASEDVGTGVQPLVDGVDELPKDRARPAVSSSPTCQDSSISRRAATPSVSLTLLNRRDVWTTRGYGPDAS